MTQQWLKMSHYSLWLHCITRKYSDEKTRRTTFRHYISLVLLIHSDSLDYINPFKPSGVKWLHFKVFTTILV